MPSDVFEIPIAQGSAGLVFDVTDLEEAQSELKRHTQAHASTLDKIATAVSIFGPDQRLRFFNTAFVQLWQLEPAWLNDKPTDSEILDRLRAERKLPEEADYRAWKAEHLQSVGQERRTGRTLASARWPHTAGDGRTASVRRRDLSLRERHGDD